MLFCIISKTTMHKAHKQLTIIHLHHSPSSPWNSITNLRHHSDTPNFLVALRAWKTNMVHFWYEISFSTPEAKNMKNFLNFKYKRLHALHVQYCTHLHSPKRYNETQPLSDHSYNACYGASLTRCRRMFVCLGIFQSHLRKQKYSQIRTWIMHEHSFAYNSVKYFVCVYLSLKLSMLHVHVQ